ncbi:MAG TPA: hypothetical protein VJ032_05290, partial [Thermoanaerobaculia bacterium]|nr:hypothetical protein [Thermoanaerobaculia bacterium]
PITFPTPPPVGFAPWPATGTITPGPGPNQLTANANAPIPGGDPAVTYKYDVHAADGTTLDPDIQNDPFPPGGVDDDVEGGGSGGHDHQGHNHKS